MRTPKPKGFIPPDRKYAKYDAVHLVRQYCKLRAKPKLSEKDADRLAAILELAMYDDALNTLINDADELIIYAEETNKDQEIQPPKQSEKPVQQDRYVPPQPPRGRGDFCLNSLSILISLLLLGGECIPSVIGWFLTHSQEATQTQRLFTFSNSAVG